MEIKEIRTIVVCKGIPASGKTTWAIEQLMRYPGKYKRANRDSLRAMLDGDRHDWDNEKFVVALRDTIIEKALIEGFDVIVDDTNLKNTVWTEICNIARNIGNVRVMEKYFPVDLKEALKRNSERERKVPEEVIENFFKKYINNKTVEVRDEFFPQVFEEYSLLDPNKDTVVLVDIDGTVAHHWNRSPYDMSKVLDDKPNVPICDLVKIISKSLPIIFVSGREDCARADTELWLTDQGITYSGIYMRPTGDGRKDVIIKREIYERDIAPKYNVKFVLDDRQQTVDGWRSLGLCCLQVAPGKF